MRVRRQMWTVALLVLTTCQRGDADRREGERKQSSASGRPEAEEAGRSQDAQPEEPAAAVPDARAALTAPGHVEPAAWLAGAERVAAVRGRRGGVRIAAAGTGWVKLLGAGGKTIAEGGGVGAAQVLEMVDINYDGNPALVVGRGVGRSARNAPASVFVHWLDSFARAEEVPLPPTSRAQVVAVVGDPERAGVLYVAVFVEKYEVSILRAARGPKGVWKTEEVAKKRMVWGLAAEDFDGDGDTELALARVYGDRQGEPGDLLLVEPGSPSAATRVPSVLGVRAVRALRDRKGGVQILYSDGWHRQYRKRALGLLTRARRAGSGWATEVLANVRGRHSYDRLRVGDLDGDGARELIAVGNGPAVRVALQGADGGAMALGGGDALDACPVDLDGDGADEVLLVGPDPEDATEARGWVWRTVDR